MSVAGDDAATFVRSARQWPAFADSVVALKELKSYFRFLIVVTNGDRISARVMAANLGSPFSEIITEEDMGFAKPNPQAFEYFLEHLEKQGVKRQRILHVAQSQYHDIGIAEEVGDRHELDLSPPRPACYGGTQIPESFTSPDFLAEAWRIWCGNTAPHSLSSTHFSLKVSRDSRLG